MGQVLCWIDEKYDHKVYNPYLVMFLIKKTIVEPHVVGCASKNGYQMTCVLRIKDCMFKIK